MIGKSMSLLVVIAGRIAFTGIWVLVRIFAKDFANAGYFVLFNQPSTKAQKPLHTLSPGI